MVRELKRTIHNENDKTEATAKDTLTPKGVIRNSVNTE
jgi:hypothetical protein